jgi:hypothetical protein
VNSWNFRSSGPAWCFVSWRDWVLTRIWSLAMDGLSIGLLVLVASGLLLWWRLPQRRAAGIFALTLGLICCAFFLYGLGTRFPPR